jgi:hypothetical protein
VLRKLNILPMFEGHLGLDIATVAGLVLLATFGFLKRSVVVVPALRGPLLVLALAFLLAPERLMTADGVEDRLPPAFVLVLVAGIVSLDPAVNRVRLGALAGLALFLARTAAMEADCEHANQVYPRLIAVLDEVPHGSRLAVAAKSNELGPLGVPIIHLPTLAVIRRGTLCPRSLPMRLSSRLP